MTHQGGHLAKVTADKFTYSDEDVPVVEVTALVDTYVSTLTIGHGRNSQSSGRAPAPEHPPTVWSAELPAAQIAARFADVTRSAVSQHLGVLREAALVVERRDGTRRLDPSQP